MDWKKTYNRRAILIVVKFRKYEEVKYIDLRADRERGRIALKEAMELQIVTKSIGLARNWRQTL